MKPTVAPAGRLAGAARAPGMAAVDDLCRLALAAHRLGYRVQLVHVDLEVRDLLRLAGLDHVLLDDGRARGGADRGDVP